MESFRFKVVKIISKEPFKRGRWSCMDFTDPPSNGTTNIEDCLAHNHPDIASSAGQGVSTVAIHSKIEQAMDLVKNHLMFAVREEMDVLKKEICDLTETNCRLERENQILKANATPETIQLIEQFNQQAQLQPRQQSPSNQITSQAQISSLQPQTISQQTITTTSPQTTQQSIAQITNQSAISTTNSTINSQPQLNHQQTNQQSNNQPQLNQAQQLSQQQIITQQSAN